MSKRYQYDSTVAEKIIMGIFKGLWWLIKLPFGNKKKTGINVEARNYITKKKTEIDTLLKSESEIELKHAVMEADKLVDYILETVGFAGETFADRLKSAQSKIEWNTYQSIWDGHKVRNQIAHEHDRSFSKVELRQAVNNLLKYIKNI